MTEEQKKKVGRPIKGKPKKSVFQIRIDDETKTILENEKHKTGKSMAQIITDLVHTLKKE